MLMSCYLRCCRNNILSFSQWESSLAGADYTAHTAKVVIYIFIQSSGKYKNAHACISGPINKQAELHRTHTQPHTYTPPSTVASIKGEFIVDICPSLDEAVIGYPFELESHGFSLMSYIKYYTLLMLNLFVMTFPAKTISQFPNNNSSPSAFILKMCNLHKF